MEVTGTIIHFGDITTGVSKSGKDWSKQEFVIQTDEQYPKKIAIIVMGDKVDQLSYYKPGQKTKCKIQIESREWQGRWYTTVMAWYLAGVN